MHPFVFAIKFGRLSLYLFAHLVIDICFFPAPSLVGSSFFLVGLVGGVVAAGGGLTEEGWRPNGAAQLCGPISHMSKNVQRTLLCHTDYTLLHLLQRHLQMVRDTELECGQGWVILMHMRHAMPCNAITRMYEN